MTQQPRECCLPCTLATVLEIRTQIQGESIHSQENYSLILLQTMLSSHANSHVKKNGTPYYLLQLENTIESYP